MSKNKDKKYQTLLLGLLFDGIGMLSLAVPFIGDFSDIILKCMNPVIPTNIIAVIIITISSYISFLF
jgi:hypothetical protein